MLRAMRRLAWLGVLVLLLLATVGCKKKAAVARAPDVDAAAALEVDAGAGPPERWGGQVDLPGAPPLIIEVRFHVGQPTTAKIAIPSQKLPPTPLSDVVHTAESLAFTLAPPGTPEAARAVFTAKRAPDGKTATGALAQGGQELPLTMHMLAEGETIGGGAARPQTPLPPFPYDARDVTYKSKDGTTLTGTLTLPKAAGKHPAVLLITGTGAQDRDETLFDHKPFLVLADHLTRAGIAVLRVDDRGVGGSTGNTGTASLDDKVDDALAGATFLASQPDIDPALIGLIGHSEGGTIAPLAAVRAAPPAPKLAFLVLLAGTGVPGREIMSSQMEAILRASGAPPEVIAKSLAGQKKILDAVMAGADEPTLRKLVTEQLDASLATASEAERAAVTPAMKKTMVDSGTAQVASPAARSFVLSDPGPTLAKLVTPVLALGGSLDLQVPAESNLGAMRAAFARAKNPDATAEVLPGLNHLFQPATKGTPDEYGTIETTFDPAALDKISTWVRAHAGLK
jgi:uncharacterized protein